MNQIPTLLLVGNSDIRDKSLLVTDVENPRFIATISLVEPDVATFLEQNRLQVEHRTPDQAKGLERVAEECAQQGRPIVVWNWWHKATEEGVSGLFEQREVYFPDTTTIEENLVAPQDQERFAQCGAAPTSEWAAYWIQRYFERQQLELQREGSVRMHSMSRR